MKKTKIEKEKKKEKEEKVKLLCSFDCELIETRSHLQVLLPNLKELSRIRVYGILKNDNGYLIKKNG